MTGGPWRRRGAAWAVTLLASLPGCGIETGEPARRPEAEVRARDRQNAAPAIQGVRILPDGEIAAGSEIELRPQGQDRDGDAVTYRYLWRVNGATVDQEGPVLSTEGLRRGDRIRARIIATDGDELSGPFETGDITLANAVPVIVSEPPGPGVEGHFRYDVRAEDPDGDRPLRYRLVRAPRGMRCLAREGAIEWQPAPGQAGRHAVEVAVEDPEGGTATQRFDLFVAPGGSVPAAPAR